MRAEELEEGDRGQSRWGENRHFSGRNAGKDSEVGEPAVWKRWRILLLGWVGPVEVVVGDQTGRVRSGGPRIRQLRVQGDGRGAIWETSPRPRWH